jgi:hypothetical protein
MPKVQVLVATYNPTSGEPLAAGSTTELDEEAYNFLRQAGAVAASDEEVKAHQMQGNRQGVYDARTTRADTGRQEAGLEPKAKS